MRLRFSLRTLDILVTLVCAYFGAWEATKRYGLKTTDETRLISRTNPAEYSTIVLPVTESSPMPFLIRRDRGGLFPTGSATPPVRYYVWLFGPRFKLYDESPFEELSESPNPWRQHLMPI